VGEGAVVGVGRMVSVGVTGLGVAVGAGAVAGAIVGLTSSRTVASCSVPSDTKADHINAMKITAPRMPNNQSTTVREPTGPFL